MFELYYKKNNNSALFKELGENKLRKIQNYIPIYKKFFNLQENNYQSINLNQPFHITSVEKTDKNNVYKCVVESKTRRENVEAFFKFSPLLDPIKFMVGNYNIDYDVKTSLPNLLDNTCHKKVIDPNNAAYVDGFFTYLTSNLLHNYKFPHGVDFYGSFLAIQDNFKLNIFDDLEYLNDSQYFHKHKGELFEINSLDEDIIFDADTRNYKRKIKIHNNISNKDVSSIKSEDFEDVFMNEPLKPQSQTIPKLTESLIFEHNAFYDNSGCECNNNECKKNSTKHACSTCSSRSSHTSNEDTLTNSSDIDDEVENQTNKSEGDVSTDDISQICESDIVCEALIKDFPVQVICLENIENTLDSLIEKDISTDEWRSCLFQIIMTLITYQKMFNFTHNDLHTNNVMFNKTDKKFLIYKYNGTYYKVPTYGRLFKIIDFGRAIYKFKNRTICSDSFHPKGDAATQYNFEPYFNKNKPRLEPNTSFDLCRLACSLYDYFMDDVEDVKTCGDPIAELISIWCTDDKGRNILYKKCGEERYPEFKLYKMIARTVHNHIPQSQVNTRFFKQYKSSRKKIGKRRVIDIDSLPSYA